MTKRNFLCLWNPNENNDITGWGPVGRSVRLHQCLKSCMCTDFWRQIAQLWRASRRWRPSEMDIAFGQSLQQMSWDLWLRREHWANLTLFFLLMAANCYWSDREMCFHMFSVRFLVVWQYLCSILSADMFSNECHAKYQRSSATEAEIPWCPPAI